jgi:glutamate dehydrogenase (NAD(P)+)
VQDLQSFFWSEGEVMDKLYRLLEQAYIQTLNLSRKKNISMRFAALSLGINRVHDAKTLRGLYP